MIRTPALTVAEFEAALTHLGVTTDSDAARALGTTPRAIRHWRQGARRIRGPVVRLIEALSAVV